MTQPKNADIVLQDLPRRFQLELAGIAVDVHASASLDLHEFESRAAKFARTSSRADEVIRVTRSDGTGASTSEQPIRVGGAADAVVLEAMGARVEIARNAGESRAFLPPPPADGRPIPFPFENVLRMLLSRRLVQRGGAMLHAAALCDDHVGIVFPGVSGAGKSTLTLRHPPDARIAEDLVAVRPGAASEGLLVESLPFLAFNQLDIGPRRRPLGALAFPRKADSLHIRRLTQAETMRRLAQTIVVYAADGIESLVLQRIVDLSSTIPAFELQLDRTTPFWPRLRDEVLAA